MAPNGWTTPEERDFLRSFLPDYEACQVKKRYKQFWQRLNVDYFAKFPMVERMFPGSKPSDLSQVNKSQVAAAILRQQQVSKSAFSFKTWGLTRDSASQRMVSLADESPQP